MGAYLALEPSLPARRLDVYRAGAAIGYGGAFTIADLKGQLGWEYHRLSGRITELVKSGHFRDTGEQRAGLTIYVIGDGTPPAGSTERAEEGPAASHGIIDEISVGAHQYDSDYSAVFLTIRIRAEDMRGWMEKGKTVTIRRRKA